MENPNLNYSEALSIRDKAFTEFLNAADVAAEKLAAYKLAKKNAEVLREVARAALGQPKLYESYDE